jgi:hypothetical protein
VLTIPHGDNGKTGNAPARTVVTIIELPVSAWVIIR